MLTIIIEALKETALMVFISGIFTISLGLPLGLFLYGTKHKQFFANNALHHILQWPSSFITSMPYLVVIVLCLPLTKWLMNHEISGSLAAIIPLTLAAVPLYANAVYEAATKVPTELGETAKSLGATPWQALLRMYLPEIYPTVIQFSVKTIKTLIGYSTISGLFGAGGLGYILLQKGYYDFSLLYIAICALLLVTLFQATQYIGILVTEHTVKK